MRLRRTEPALLAVVLVLLVLGLDLLWAALGGSTGSLAYGLIDEPAHLATCGIALLAFSSLRGGRLTPAFVLAALLASVAIDLDHLPGYLGWNGLTGSLPRPYSHSLTTGAVLLAAGLVGRGRYRSIMLGLSFGVAAHLLRDSATGPGLALAWPLSDQILLVPQSLFLAALPVAALGVAVSWPPRILGPARAGAAALLAVIVGLALLPSTSSAAPTIGVGAYIPGADKNPALIDDYAKRVGRSPVIVSSYRVWGPSLVEAEQLDSVISRGAVPMITWEPWDEEEAPVSLWGIAAGEYDSYLSEAAREVAAWGQPLFLRFAHEMNGNWYPWGWGVDGNTPAAYKAAWRHVVDVFRAQGAANVRWVWCPYVSNGRPGQFKSFYPGDAWVDWAGLDGFNWGNYRTWQSFETIFALSYQRLIRATARPIMIGETGVSQAGGSKPRWISRTFRRQLPAYTHVRALVWYDAADDRADFRVDSSEGSLLALRSALSERIYATDRKTLLSTPPLLGKPRPPRPPASHRHGGSGSKR